MVNAPTTQRLGAIDCGSNAIRVVIAEINESQKLNRIYADRVSVRLGHRAFTRGELDGPTIEQAVEAFTRFRQLFDQHGVTRYRAVATSAARSAGNRDVLLHRIYHEAGIEVDVIDGEEEARLVRKAVIRAFAGQKTPTLVLDLGGGSLEVNLRRGSRWSGTSLPVGTVRLVESFGLDGVIGHEEAGMVRRYTATLLQTVRPLPTETPSPAAICGGNAETFADLFGNVGVDGMPGFELEALERALPTILGTDVEGRIQRFGVRRDRAEVMGVAALVVATVARGLHATRLTAPGVGVRDALLWELVEATSSGETQTTSAQGKAILTAARTFAQRVGHDSNHGEQVRKLARQIFDQLSDVHGLPSELGSVLEVASLLHDVGEVVNARSHHKHSEYMIRWGRIPGLDTPYREMVAALVRTHRKNPPDLKKHPVYAELPKPQRQQVRKLAALLRLADGLDTDHRQGIDRIIASRLGNTIALDLLVTSEGIKASIDTTPLLRKADLFEAEFGYKVTFTIGTAKLPPTE